MALLVGPMMKKAGKDSIKPNVSGVYAYGPIRCPAGFSDP
jgi:hypothetical protein